MSRAVEKMAELSGGVAHAGVQEDTESLDDAEAAAISRWLEELIIERKRRENTEIIAVGAD